MPSAPRTAIHRDVPLPTKVSFYAVRLCPLPGAIESKEAKRKKPKILASFGANSAICILAEAPFIVFGGQKLVTDRTLLRLCVIAGKRSVRHAFFVHRRDEN
jgi:hypothetical protein